MKKFILATIFILTLSINVLAQTDNSIEEAKTKATVQKMQNSSVSVLILGQDGSGGMCSGIVIRNTKTESVVLTAKHCVALSADIYVDDYQVSDFRVSPTDDLAVLFIPEHIDNKVAVTMTKNNPKSLTLLFHFGYPDMTAKISVGYILRRTKDDYYAKIDVVHGCSGGGMFNDKGELIGIVYGMIEWSENLRLTVFNPISDVYTFLKITGVKI